MILLCCYTEKEALADEAGCHRTYIRMLERRQGNPSLKVLVSIAKVLGVSINEVFTPD